MKTGIVGIFSFFMLPMSNISASEAKLQTYRQIYDSLLVATEVVPDTVIRNVFDDVARLLPPTGSVSELSAFTLTATSRLAAEVCSKFIRRDSARPVATRVAHRLVDFKIPPSGMTPSIRESVASEYAQLFWGRAPSEIELHTLSQLISDFSQSDRSSHVTALMPACVATASSISNLVK